ncbi:hypothetical protein SuNHUV7_15420 (plasmid) [Pseudoseohaeicola sp. NH-UV-7]
MWREGRKTCVYERVLDYFANGVGAFVDLALETDHLHRAIYHIRLERPLASMLKWSASECRMRFIYPLGVFG